MIKKYIRGHQTRGAEVIETLKKIGGRDDRSIDGTDPTGIYHIDINNCIDMAYNGTTLGQLLLENYKEIKLPNSLPTTWDEWVKQNPVIDGEYYISNSSKIHPYHRAPELERRAMYDANLFATEEDAKAILALIKLKRLRDTYRQGWVPDWGNEYQLKYSISHDGELIIKKSPYRLPKFLSFPTEEIRDEFFENFKDLIVEAKEFI